MEKVILLLVLSILSTTLYAENKDDAYYKQLQEHVKKLNQISDNQRKHEEYLENCRKNNTFDCPLREKFVTANTGEPVYTKYIERWASRINNIGNIDYPKEAVKNNLQGTIIVKTAIYSDGVLKDVNISKSSGHKVLDDHVIQTIKSASPFAPFPIEISNDVDILHIIRTLKYQ